MVVNVVFVVIVIIIVSSSPANVIGTCSIVAGCVISGEVTVVVVIVVVGAVTVAVARNICFPVLVIMMSQAGVTGAINMVSITSVVVDGAVSLIKGVVDSGISRIKEA